MTRMFTLLMAEAEYIATKMQKRDAALQTELLKLEKQKAAIEAERKSIGLAPKRALNFQPKLGPDYQCPVCWVQHEARSRLRCVANPDADEFVCDVCDKSYVFPLRD